MLENLRANITFATIENKTMNERIDMLQEYIQDDPSDTFSRYALALEHAKIGETSKAIEYLKQLRIIDSEYLALYYQLGKLLQQMQILNQKIVLLNLM